MVLASRQEKPAIFAATVHPVNLPKYDSEQMAIVKPQVMPAITTVRTLQVNDTKISVPLLRRPRSVDRPDSMKY